MKKNEEDLSDGGRIDKAACNECESNEALRILQTRGMICGCRAKKIEDMGKALLQNEEFEEAKIILGIAFRNALKAPVNEEFNSLTNDYLWCLLILDEFDEMLITCEQALSALQGASCPEDIKEETQSMTYHYLGRVFLSQHRIEDALGCFTKAYLLCPSSVSNKMAFAQYHEAVDDTASVRAICKKVLKERPESGEAHFRLGMTYFFSGDAGEAKKHLMRAYRIEAGPHTAANILVCMAALGELKVPTNMDEEKYIVELVETGRADVEIRKEIRKDQARENVKNTIDKMFGGG